MKHDIVALEESLLAISGLDRPHLPEPAGPPQLGAVT
jgi:hypothetical protein